MNSFVVEYQPTLSVLSKNRIKFSKPTCSTFQISRINYERIFTLFMITVIRH